MYFLGEITAAVAQAMRDDGYEDAAAEILEVEVQGCTYDKTAKAGYIYFRQVESVLPGEVPCAQTVAFAAPYWFNVDLRSSGRVVGIELLSPPEFHEIRQANPVATNANP